MHKRTVGIWLRRQENLTERTREFDLEDKGIWLRGQGIRSLRPNRSQCRAIPVAVPGQEAWTQTGRSAGPRSLNQEAWTQTGRSAGCTSPPPHQSAWRPEKARLHVAVAWPHLHIRSPIDYVGLWGVGLIGKCMKQKEPKSTLLADNTQGLRTIKQTKPRPVASEAPYPPTNWKIYETKKMLKINYVGCEGNSDEEMMSQASI